jgi:hypothetical protein
MPNAARQVLRLLLTASLSLAWACSGKVSGDDDDAPGGDAAGAEDGYIGPDGCVSQRNFFAQRLWSPVLDRICMNCHAPDGIASEQNAALQLVSSGYPGFIESNMENMAMVARFEFDGKSVLLRKPLGEMDHGGGAVLEEDSEEYGAIVEFVELLDSDDVCESVPLPTFDDVELLDAHATFRKATLQLAGRIPDDDELQRLDEDGDDALAPLLDGLLEEEAFLERLQDIYNDRLLTDLYLRYNGAATNLLNSTDYPALQDEMYDMLAEDVRLEANRALAREPLELIAHVVRNDRPFSEILTADYTVVNPFSSLVYGVYPEFSDPEDADEFVEVRISIDRDGDGIDIPHAGVMTTPVFLNRMPTTPTNRNRHRARKLLEIFLATDLLRINTRPIDPEASSGFNNPTRDDPQCTGCHRQLDPIAGAFQKWDERDQERYFPDREWYPEVFPPGFGKEVMPTSDYDRAQAWLAERMVADPRFVIATVHTLYAGITGHQPLLYPQDSDAEDFSQQRRAWEAQDAVFRAVGDAFVADDMNLKTLVRELVLTPYFRAANASEELSGAREKELVDVGTGRFSIPRVLADKIEAVTGVSWARGWDSRPYLTSDYRILYGGIDSDSVTERLTVPNGIMANLAWRMANEVACNVTARDFNQPRSDRLLFPEVEPSDAPATLTGDEIPAAVERIKANIRYLHERVLGERLQEGDPELERTYALFLETWDEGAHEVEDGALPGRLTWQCQARVDPDTGEDLPDEDRLVDDESYTVRAWMAVITYLLADYQFLYE